MAKSNEIGEDMDFSAFEKAIMEALIADLKPYQLPVRSQYEAAKVAIRDFTGVGCFTMISVPESVARMTVGEAFEATAYLEIRGLEWGAMANLFSRNGAINCLELITLSEDWPDDPVLLSITTGGSSRNDGRSVKFHYKRENGKLQYQGQEFQEATQE